MKKIIAIVALCAASLSLANSAAVTKYYGSSKSTIYHYPRCEWAQKILSENLLVFDSKEDAHKRGYRACKVCKP